MQLERPVLVTYTKYLLVSPVGKSAIISQLRVWLFTFTVIEAFGERSTNPGIRFTGDFIFPPFVGKN